MGWESFGVVRFDLGPCLQGQTRIANIKVLITRLLMVLEVWDGKPTYRKSLARNLLVWSDLTFGPLLQGQMRTAKLKSAYNSQSIGVVRLDLGPLLQGQTKIAKLKVLITHILLVLEVWDGKPTCRKSLAVILLVWSDLTLGPSFKLS